MKNEIFYDSNNLKIEQLKHNLLIKMSQSCAWDQPWNKPWNDTPEKRKLLYMDSKILKTRTLLIEERKKLSQKGNKETNESVKKCESLQKNLARFEAQRSKMVVKR